MGSTLQGSLSHWRWSLRFTGSTGWPWRFKWKGDLLKGSVQWQFGPGRHACALMASASLAVPEGEGTGGPGGSAPLPDDLHWVAVSHRGRGTHLGEAQWAGGVGSSGFAKNQPPAVRHRSPPGSIITGGAKLPPGWADLWGGVTSPGWEGPRGMHAWGGVQSGRGLWVMEPQPPDVQRGAEHGLPQGRASLDHPWEELALLFFTMEKRTEQEGSSPTVRSCLPPPTVPSFPPPLVLPPPLTLTPLGGLQALRRPDASPPVHGPQVITSSPASVSSSASGGGNAHPRW